MELGDNYESSDTEESEQEAEDEDDESFYGEEVEVKSFNLDTPEMMKKVTDDGTESMTNTIAAE